jgi:hypothetical protein
MNKRGPVIIGFGHFGRKNARRVIVALKKHGLRRGDTVAMETTRGEMKGIRQLNRENRVEDYLRFRGTKVRKTGAAGRRRAWQPGAARPWPRDLRIEKEQMRFVSLLDKFFHSMDVRVAPLDTDAGRKRAIKAQKVMHDESANPLIRMVAGFEFLPMREEGWKKRLAGQKGKRPAFILVGAAHVSGMKRLVPHERAVRIARVPQSAEATAEGIRQKYFRILAEMETAGKGRK